jgi:eukaryotic-like serine/threonine-protein kinase
MRPEQTQELWRRIERLWNAALELPQPERAAFLAEACEGDEELRREVESLLRFDLRAKNFIESPALEVAAQGQAEAQEESLIGRMIGHYQILSLLGEGGMSEVYLALDTSLERRVALKLLPAKFTQDADRLRRFIQEAKAASALNHPNIITIHEIGATEDVHFVATEYIEGQTLRQLMASAPLALNRALDVTTQIANALAVAHAAGIVHRDIKPENVMVRPDGYLKVLDFGIAKLLTGGQGDVATERQRDGATGRRGEWATGRQGNWATGEQGDGATERQRERETEGQRDGEKKSEIDNLPVSPSPRRPVAPSPRPSTLPYTEAGMVLGTTPYMSPEQARGLAVDERTDIFSLGVLLYEMIAGRLPFDGATRGDIIQAIIEREPPPLGAGASPALREVVSRALRKDRAKRYQSVNELLDNLRQLKRELRTSGHLQMAYQPSAWNEATLITSGARLDTRTQASEQITVEGKTTTQPGNRASLGRLARVLKWRALIPLALFAIGVAGWLAYLYSRPPQTAIDSLAVLPFVYDGPGENIDAKAEYLADGLTDGLINSLAQLPSVKVKARNSVFRFKKDQSDPTAIARRLGVRAVLTGRITHRGDELTISAELTDASDGSHLWGARYERRLSDLIVVQEEIAQRITAGLRLKLTDAESKRLGKRYTENAEAHQLYLRGRQVFLQFTPEGSRKALEYFHQAIDLDSGYALAYAGIGYVYAVGAGTYEEPGEAMRKAREASLQALKLDEDLPQAHFSLALVKWWFDWDWTAAEAEFKRAIELDPSNALERAVYADFLSTQERFTDAMVQAQHAQELDPISAFVSSAQAKVFYNSRKYDRALEAYRQILELDPDSARGRREIGRILLQQGKYAEAIAALVQVVARKSEPDFISELARAYAVAGRRDEARRSLAQLLQIAKRRYVPPVYIAKVYAGLGENAQALALLNQAFQARSDQLTELRVEPAFDPLRADPRFVDLLRRVGLAK